MNQVTVTASDVEMFRNRSGNPHMLRRGNRVQIVGEEYYRQMPQRGRLIVTRADLAAIDPEADTYEPAMLAALLSDYATHMED